MEDEDNKLSLRDKCAIEILQALIMRTTGTSFDDRVKFFIDHWNFKSQPDIMQLADDQMRALIRAAYRIADIMREVRLTAFE